MGKKIAILILPYISRSNGNQTIKKHFSWKIIKCDKETIPRPISKKIKSEHVSGLIVKSFMQYVFIVCQVEGYQSILKLSCTPLSFPSCNLAFTSWN